MIEEIDKKIIRAIQGDLPLDVRPFAILSRKIGISEDELIERIDLQSSSRLEKLTAGISDLAVDKKAAGVLHKVEGLIDEYLETEEGNRQEIEKEGRELLHQLRISGSAVRKINYNAKEEWRRKMDTGAVPYQKDIDTLKQELLELN